MQFQMNKLNNPTSYNKSKNELRLKRCSDSVRHFIFMSYCFVYILKNCWTADFCIFVVISANSFIYYLLELKFAQHYNTVIVYKSRKWGMKKATGPFWIVLQKPGSVFTG